MSGAAIGFILQQFGVYSEFFWSGQESFSGFIEIFTSKYVNKEK